MQTDLIMYTYYDHVKVSLVTFNGNWLYKKTFSYVKLSSIINTLT